MSTMSPTPKKAPKTDMQSITFTFSPRKQEAVNTTTIGAKLNKSVLSPIDMYLSEWNNSSDATFAITERTKINHELCLFSWTKGCLKIPA